MQAVQWQSGPLVRWLQDGREGMGRGVGEGGE